MTSPAIRVEGLGKRYRIGAATERHDTLRDAIASAVRSPLQNLKRLRRLTQFTEEDDADDVVWALRDVSFEVPVGQVLGVVGRNGAGKSTLLKILSRITNPSRGRAVIQGQSGVLLEVGTGFHPELTGRENIYLNGAILGMDKDYIDAHLDEIVTFAGVEQFIDTPIKRFSSGMKVRLAFAVAAHLQPEILIIDEVLSVGDVGFQKKCIGKMESVARGGRTVLFVSHNMAAVKSLCSRCILLEGGHMVMDDTPERVVDYYVSQFRETLSDREAGRLPADRDYYRGAGDGYFLGYPGGEAALSVECGDPVTLEFEIEAPDVLPAATAGVTISKAEGGKVVSMSSKVQNVASSRGESSRWYVRCDMGRLPLNAGHYEVTVYFGSEKRDVARFSGAFSLEVLPKDVFGWGNRLPPEQAWGSVYWAPEWEIRPG